MKIVHVVSGSLAGGAAIGALQLHEALTRLGVDSLLLNNHFRGKDDNGRIKGAHPEWLLWLVLRAQARLDDLPLKVYPARRKTAWSCGLTGTTLSKMDDINDADIVHLHWINEGFISMASIGKIRKPVIWTMRDMWPLTGGCHYSLGCEKYQTHCGACFQLGSNKEQDLSYRLFDKKKAALGRDIYLVGASKWLSGCASASGILAGREIRTIYNGACTENFGLSTSEEARRELGLPLHRKIILVGAQNLFFPYKGGEFLVAALREPGILQADPLLVSFGRGSEILRRQVSLDLTSFGFVSDRTRLANLYAAADVFVVASIQEAFAKTAIEALASGTPVVCFDTGGHGEVVRQGIDGYKAKPGDFIGLSLGIEQALEKGRAHFTEEARKRAKEYDVKFSARQYLSLYEEILRRNKSADSRFKNTISYHHEN